VPLICNLHRYTAAEEIAAAARRGTSPFASPRGAGSDPDTTTTRTGGRTNNPPAEHTPVSPIQFGRGVGSSSDSSEEAASERATEQEPAGGEMMRLESMGAAPGAVTSQPGPVTEAWGTVRRGLAVQLPGGEEGGAGTNPGGAATGGGPGGPGGHAAKQRQRRSHFASLMAQVAQVSSPTRLIRARVSRAASSLLSEVDEDESAVFARRMQSAFLLFLSWAYMAVAQINVEYYTCTATGDGRYVLDMDPTVQCWVGWHQALWLPAMAGTLFYVIGIPLFFALTLFKHRRLLSVGGPHSR
jgi:hypothetical protein